MENECFSCLSVSGKRPLFPESRMYEGNYWLVEHAYPVALKGWLVIVLKRHVEALHELTTEEFEELGVLTERMLKILKQLLNCEKEYLMCFAEGDNYHHIHFHLVAKPADLPTELKGPNIFTKLKVSEAESYDKSELIDFCQQVKALLRN